MRILPHVQLIGKRFNSLRLLDLAAGRKNRRRCGKFSCRCGAVFVWEIDRVVSGQKKHCGCLTVRDGNRTHGMRNSPEYRVWKAMKQRCLNPKSKDFKRYGAAGIKMHRSWARSFAAFHKELGKRPPGTTIDRIDNRRGYVPGNVRWASGTVQACNRRNSWVVSIRGSQYPSVEGAAKALGVSHITIMRWCSGSVDPRRNNKFTPPKTDCFLQRKYHENH